MAKAREKSALETGCENKKSYTVNFIDDMFNDENAAFSDILRSLSKSETPTVLLVADQNVVQKTQSLGFVFRKIAKIIVDIFCGNFERFI